MRRQQTLILPHLTSTQATSGQLEEFTLAHVFDAAVRGDKTGVYIYKPKEDPIKFPDATITKTKVRYHLMPLTWHDMS